MRDDSNHADPAVNVEVTPADQEAKAALNPRSPPGEHDFNRRHHKENEADQGIEAKKGMLYPIEGTSSGQPMFQ